MGEKLQRGTPRQSQAGFTIIELMVVITIIGVLASFAIPSFNSMIYDNRRTTVVNELLANLMLARAEAAKRGQPVSVCGLTSSGGTSCTGGTTWDYGWMVFLDPDGNGAIANASDVLAKYVNPYEIKVRSSQNGGPIVLKPFNQATTAGYVLVCDKRGDSNSRHVCVETNGRSHAQETACDAANDSQTCP